MLHLPTIMTVKLFFIISGERKLEMCNAEFMQNELLFLIFKVITFYHPEKYTDWKCFFMGSI